jgi:hypothetical protein
MEERKMRNHYQPWFQRQPPSFTRWNKYERQVWTGLGRGMYFNRVGVEISMLEWAILFENMKYRRIGYTKLDAKSYISTVWLGMSGCYGDPYLFETMMLPDADFQERYHTEKEARAGHRRTVKKWLASVETAKEALHGR